KVLLALLHRPELRRDVLRSLRDAGPDPEAARQVIAWWDKLAGEEKEADVERRELAAQVLLTLGKGAPKDGRLKALAELAGRRPRTEAQWRDALAGPGDAAAGERVFFHPRGPRCHTCHRIDGRGAAVGPDLSLVGRSLGRDKLIESILSPS